MEVNTTCTNSGIRAAKIRMQGKVRRLTYLRVAWVIARTACGSCWIRDTEGKVTRDTAWVMAWLL